MKKLLLIVILFLLISLPAIPQTQKYITINGEGINYVLINNEPYVLLLEMERMGYPQSWFSNVPYSHYGGLYYYQLQGCCNLVGILSAEHVGNEFRIKLNSSKLIISVWKDRTDFNGTIDVYIIDSAGYRRGYVSATMGRKYTVVVPPGSNYHVVTGECYAYNTVTEEPLTGIKKEKKDIKYHYIWEKYINAPAGETVIVDLKDDCLKIYE